MGIVELKKRFGIGLTGGIATGKSQVARIIKDSGFLVIDADQLSRDSVAPGSPSLHAIAQAFGADLVQPDGHLDRKKLGRLVFSDPAQRKKLEAITHPAIAQALEDQIVAAGLLQAPQLWFYEAPLLFEAGIDGQYRSVWVTWCPTEVQIERLCARDLVDADFAKQVIGNQLSPDVKKQRADLVIDTNCGLDQLRSTVRDALAKLPKEFS